jgi:hypothetical protein
MIQAAVRKAGKGKGEGKEGHADFGSSDEADADEDKYADAAEMRLDKNLMLKPELPYATCVYEKIPPSI